MTLGSGIAIAAIWAAVAVTAVWCGPVAAVVTAILAFGATVVVAEGLS